LSESKSKEIIRSPQPLPIKKAIKKIVKKNEYFTKLHEEAIIKYATSNDKQEKSVLYVTLIQPAFNEMVDKIVFTYKFTSLPNIEDLKEECKIWLTTILDKFDVSKGSKAFSYFSVITKNWFIHKVKKNSSGREVSLEDISQEFEEEHLFVLNNYDDLREKEEFWIALMSEMNSWSALAKKEQEKKVYEAIKEIINKRDEITIFNKKAIYLYIREITGLSTKQIVTNLKKFKNTYYKFINNWNNGNIKHITVKKTDDKQKPTGISGESY